MHNIIIKYALPIAMSKQLKLNECKRVVDVDKFSEYALRLSAVKKSSNGDESDIERILNELSKKTPSRDVLLKTRLGFILKDLAENESLSRPIREKARLLRHKWKEFHKKLILAPKLDVKCDKPTTEGRERAKKTLESALMSSKAVTSALAPFDPNSDAHIDLLNQLEFAIFEYSEKLVNARYFNRVRQCAHLLETNAEMRERLLRFKISCEDLVQAHLKAADSVFKRFNTDSSLPVVIAAGAAAPFFPHDDLLLTQ